jgi:hypothetical protein
MVVRNLSGSYFRPIRDPADPESSGAMVTVANAVSVAAATALVWPAISVEGYSWAAIQTQFSGITAANFQTTLRGSVDAMPGAGAAQILTWLVGTTLSRAALLGAGSSTGDVWMIDIRALRWLQIHTTNGDGAAAATVTIKVVLFP